MATTEERMERLHRLLNELPENELPTVERFLEFVRQEARQSSEGTTDEDRTWMDADLSAIAAVEPFDWGPEGPPKTKPIDHMPGVGLVVRGGKSTRGR